MFGAVGVVEAFPAAGRAAEGGRGPAGGSCGGGGDCGGGGGAPSGSPDAAAAAVGSAIFSAAVRCVVYRRHKTGDVKSHR